HMFGRTMRVEFDRASDKRDFARAIERHLPVSREASTVESPDRIYRVLPWIGVAEGFRVLVNRGPLATAHSIEDAAGHVATDAQTFVAAAASAYTFIHAGVVSLGGRAIVLPGDSGAGKSTLVQAFLNAGATYGSDEFAVIDASGAVHAFARPLRLRD